MKASIALIPLTLVALGCADAGGDAAPEVAVRDSAGITIVENPMPPDSGGALALAAEPEVVIGVLEGAPEYQLYQVSGLARLSDGRIAVANGGSGEVRYFDASGRFVSASGRKGSGPGEFQGMGDMWPLAGDSLVLFDWNLDRFTLLDERGDFVHSRNLQRGSGSLGFPIGMLDAEHVVLRQSGWSISDRPAGAFADTLQLRLLDWREEQAAAGDPILTFPGGQAYVYRTERMSIFTSVFLSAVPQPVVREGAIHLGLGTEFGFHVYDRSGTLQRIVRREHPREPLTREMRDAAVERRLEQVENENFRRTEREVLAGMPVPAHLPAHGRIMIDRLGRTWMQRYDLEVGQIGTTDVPIIWDVFDDDGRWIAAVSTPPRFGARDIGADYVLGVAVDEFDVEQVRLYGLESR